MKIDGSKWWLPWKTQSGEDITAILSSMGFEIVDTLGDSCKVIPPEGWTGKLEKGIDPLVSDGVICDENGTPRLKCHEDEADDYAPDPHDIYYTEVVA